jgi:hypothetical protein
MMVQQRQCFNNEGAFRSQIPSGATCEISKRVFWSMIFSETGSHPRIKSKSMLFRVTLYEMK